MAIVRERDLIAMIFIHLKDIYSNKIFEFSIRIYRDYLLYHYSIVQRTKYSDD